MWFSLTEHACPETASTDYIALQYHRRYKTYSMRSVLFPRKYIRYLLPRPEWHILCGPFFSLANISNTCYLVQQWLKSITFKVFLASLLRISSTPQISLDVRYTLPAVLYGNDEARNISGDENSRLEIIFIIC